MKSIRLGYSNSAPNRYPAPRRYRTTPILRLGFVLAAFALTTSAAFAHPHRGVVHYSDGLWFDGVAFRLLGLYAVDGVFRADPGGRPVDRTVDLSGKYVDPPFADAHTHHFSDGQDVDTQIADYVRQGIFYAKNPDNTRVWTGDLRI